MKYLFLFLLVTAITFGNTQDFPSDSLLLTTIYGKVDKSFEVSFKARIALNNQNLLFIITTAPSFNLHGHQFGFRGFYFIQEKPKLKLVKSIVSSDELPIGDINESEIIDIGKGKIALVSTFGSTGNNHFESDKSIYLLEYGKITHLLTIDTGYDNSAWKIPEDKNSECEAEAFESNFKIRKSKKEWFDIDVYRTEFAFSKGCTDRYVKTEQILSYSYSNGKYSANKSKIK